MPGKKQNPPEELLPQSDEEIPEKLIDAEDFPLENVFLTTPVASDNDCTGIAVTLPENEHEQEAINSLRHNPATGALEPAPHIGEPPRKKS